MLAGSIDKTLYISSLVCFVGVVLVGVFFIFSYTQAGRLVIDSTRLHLRAFTSGEGRIRLSSSEEARWLIQTIQRVARNAKRPLQVYFAKVLMKDLDTKCTLIFRPFRHLLARTRQDSRPWNSRLLQHKLQFQALVPARVVVLFDNEWPASSLRVLPDRSSEPLEILGRQYCHYWLGVHRPLWLVSRFPQVSRCRPEHCSLGPEYKLIQWADILMDGNRIPFGISLSLTISMSALKDFYWRSCSSCRVKACLVSHFTSEIVSAFNSSPWRWGHWSLKCC